MTFCHTETFITYIKRDYELLGINESRCVFTWWLQQLITNIMAYIHAYYNVLKYVKHK